MQNMTELVTPSTSCLIDEDVKPGQNAETTADLSSIVTDQLRVSAEEVDFEDYLRASFSYDKAGRRAVCVDQVVEKLPQGAAVLDAGCGTGNYMTALVNSGKCSTYIGIDINEGMLYHAKQKATQLRAVENQSCDVTVIAATLLEELPFEDNVFDMVLFNQVLPHVCDIRVFDKLKYINKMMSEFQRILKPGGYISLNTCSHEQLSAVWYNNALPEATEMLKKRTPDVEDVKEILGNAGFSDITAVRDDKPLLGKEFWKYETCFTESYRNGDAIWTMASDEEYSKGMMTMKYALREERETFDTIARAGIEKSGCTTQMFGRKA